MLVVSWLVFLGLTFVFTSAEDFAVEPSQEKFELLRKFLRIFTERDFLIVTNAGLMLLVLFLGGGGDGESKSFSLNQLLIATLIVAVQVLLSLFALQHLVEKLLSLAERVVPRKFRLH